MDVLSVHNDIWILLGTLSYFNKNIIKKNSYDLF
jgi:hypothetical protein